MSKFPKTAIVILNWNGEQLFSKFLPSVIENSQSENIEIIVADNGSSSFPLSHPNLGGQYNQHPPVLKPDYNLQQNHSFSLNQ